MINCVEYEIHRPEVEGLVPQILQQREFEWKLILGPI